MVFVGGYWMSLEVGEWSFLSGDVVADAAVAVSSNTVGGWKVVV